MFGWSHPGRLAAGVAKGRKDKATSQYDGVRAWGLGVKWLRVLVVRESGNPDNTGHLMRRIFEHAGKTTR